MFSCHVFGDILVVLFVDVTAAVCTLAAAVAPSVFYQRMQVKKAYLVLSLFHWPVMSGFAQNGDNANSYVKRAWASL